MYKFNYENQTFTLQALTPTIPDLPLTVTLQINRRCNIQCIYCSESEVLEDLNIETLKIIIKNLKGIDRIIISGGEPMMHDNIYKILKICRDSFPVVAMATNAILVDTKAAQELVKYVDYFDITLDGSRNIHNQIRGEYDHVLRGSFNLKNAGAELSVVTVLFNKNKDSIKYIAAIADSLGAKKLKILSPIPKGRGNLISNEKLDADEAGNIFNDLKVTKDILKLDIKLVMTDWERIKEGHALLIHPTGDVVASPVWTKAECIHYIGNIIDNDISSIWAEYPYKENHINKYIEKTMLVY